MSYVVLARKYRPTTFDDVIGQSHIATTLKNAIALDRIAHAYVFAGPRGVGKTSMARIFACALICGDTTKSKSSKQAAQEIAEGRSMDVMEIDGASNRGIEDIRTIRENIKFAPAYGKYKIYIIDEVHQITQDAFSALLKTLEEPPAHAKFIFATTAPQKIPATVLSRCQRFDFRRIQTKDIVKLLNGIAKKEKIKIDEAAVFEIAKAADGSLRDAESILDQVASYSKEKVTFEHVAHALGSLNPDKLLQLFEAVQKQECETVLKFVQAIIETGKEPGYFIEKCLEHVRNLLVVKTAESLIDTVDGSDVYCEGLKSQAKCFARQDLFYIFSVLQGAQEKLRLFRSRRIPLEMALIKCTTREPMIPIEKLETQVAAELKAVKKNSVRTEPRPVASVEEIELDLPAAPPSENTSPKAEPIKSNPSQAQAIPDELWKNFVLRVKAEKISAASFLQDAEPLDVEGDVVQIIFPPESRFSSEALSTDENRALLEKHLSDLFERPVGVNFRIQETASSKLKAELASAEAEPKGEAAIVKKAIGIFGGRVVRS